MNVVNVSAGRAVYKSAGPRNPFESVRWSARKQKLEKEGRRWRRGYGGRGPGGVFCELRLYRVLGNKKITRLPGSYRLWISHKQALLMFWSPAQLVHNKPGMRERPLGGVTYSSYEREPLSVYVSTGH